jgi:hypothetical protein
MADNVTMNAGTGGVTAAADDVAGVHYQYVKLADGTADSATKIAAGGGTEATALRVTLATDSTGVVSVDDNGGALTVDNAGTFAVQAALAAGTNNIGDVDVLTVPADPFGANADAASATGSISAKLRFIAGTGIPVTGTVTVGSHAVTNAGTFATQVDGAALTALQLIDDAVFAEDTAAQAADKGIAILAVRRDADTSLVGADNDYANLQVNAAGSLKVAITAGAGSGGTSIADGASFTRDTTSVTPVGAVVETSAPTLTNGDAAGLSMTTGGALRVAVASGGVAGIAEDSAAAGGEEGIMVLAVRRDSASSGVGADGDFAALSVTSDGSLRVSGGGGGTQYAEDAAHVSADTGTMALAVRRDTAAVGSGTDGDYSTLNVNASGRLYTSTTVDAALPAGTNNIGDVDVLTVPSDPFGANADAASATGSISAKLRFIAATGIPVTGTVTVGSHAVTNAGTFATQVDGAALTALQLIDNACIADDAAFAPASSGVHVAGFFADETATDSVDEGDAGAARMTLDRKQITTLYAHAAAGGATPHQNLDVDETEDDVKTSAGKVFWLHAMNLSNAKRYLKFYNATAANVTVGSTTPVLTLPIPTMGDTNGAGFTINFGDIGVQFDTAICIAATTGFAVADTGAPGANEIIVNLGYL